MKVHHEKLFVSLTAALIAAFISIPGPSEAAKKVYSPRRMDGVSDLKSRTNFWPVAVMIDNHTAARPQSGLQQASFVYETLAEGGIPRFMAVYADMNVARIGPVRSTRPYFVRYAAEWGAAVAHAGGSPDGLKEVQKQRLLSIFALKGWTAKYFFRAFGGGVHGLYTDSKKLVAAMKAGRVWKHTPNYKPYSFQNDPVRAKRGKSNSGVTIDLGYGRNYDIEYRYSRPKNVYYRYTGGRKHIDRLTNKQITVRNVIILNVPKERVLDRRGRLDIKTIGKGSGYLLRDGKKIKITWTKQSTKSKTVFKTTNGKEVKLNRGNTWITIVPKGHAYKFF